MEPETRSRLAGKCAEPDDRLCTLLGRHLSLASTRLARQSAESRRYGRTSPNDLPKAPPTAGPVAAPAVQARFMTPKASPCAIPARSAPSDTSAIPGV